MAEVTAPLDVLSARSQRRTSGDFFAVNLRKSPIDAGGYRRPRRLGDFLGCQPEEVAKRRDGVKARPAARPGHGAQLSCTAVRRGSSP